MSKNCVIMQRMKENYENRAKHFLVRRTPVIIRIDGKAFHTYTKGLDKPFDEGLIRDMQNTAVYLCEQIQGAKCAYVQSDEISILVTDYDTLTTDGWFNYNQSKIESISASLATAKFNELRIMKPLMLGEYSCTDSDIMDLQNDDYKFKLGLFDSRAFNIPKEEVANYFLARQKDAVKNSISSLAQSLYSHKEINGKNQSDMQEMCFQKGVNWNDLHWSKKRGSFIIKNTYVNDEIALVYPELAFLDNHNGKLEFYPAGCRDDIEHSICRRYIKNNENDTWQDVEIKNIRSKWGVVETPFTFNDEVFKNLI